MLDVARAKRSDVDWCRADATSLPYPAASFALVLSVTALEFVPEPERALAEMYRVTAPGGRLVVGTLNAESAMGKAYAREAELKDTPFRLARFFNAQGFVAALAELGPVHWSGSVFFGPSAPRPWVGRLTDWFGQRLCRAHGALLVGRVDK
jgi:ubiquinone/menaquinone biosynthesis C-methylase UbiE